jgi:uncharacterized delta-60 repeat protein
VVAGVCCGGGIVARFMPNGRLDRSFGNEGQALLPGEPTVGLAIDSLGRIVLAGEDSDGLSVTRLTAQGSPDPTFGSGGTASPGFAGTVSGIAVERSGEIVVSGSTQACPDPFSCRSEFALVGLTQSGSLDPAFGSGGEVSTDFGVGRHGAESSSITVGRPGGEITIAGVLLSNGGDHQFALARYTPTGALDPRFGEGGLVTTAFPPSTAIRAAQVNSRRKRATFVVEGSPPEPRDFQCAPRSRAAPRAPFTRCGVPASFHSEIASRVEFAHLQPGRYDFLVRAVGPAGHDLSPATHRFTIAHN